MIKRHTVHQIFRFIVDDFTTSWNALVARDKGSGGGGNFFFALMSMVLLEFACRVCKGNPSGLASFGRELANIEPRYFAKIPGTWAGPTGCELPGPHSDSHLLAMMFDLIRNGKAHQYQSVIVDCPDAQIDMDIAGPRRGREIGKPGRRRPRKHLAYKRNSVGDLSLYIRPDQLFLDFRTAVDRSGIVALGTISPADLKRRKAFSVQDLESHLVASGHKPGNW